MADPEPPCGVYREAVEFIGSTTRILVDSSLMADWPSAMRAVRQISNWRQDRRKAFRG
jgi:hypothetical protein